MAKAPAHKALTKATVKSAVTLHLGDEETDGAQVQVQLSLSPASGEGVTNSSSIVLRFPLPEGCVMAGQEMAKAMARTEAAAILRKMAAQVAKPKGK